MLFPHTAHIRLDIYRNPLESSIQFFLESEGLSLKPMTLRGMTVGWTIEGLSIALTIMLVDRHRLRVYQDYPEVALKHQVDVPLFWDMLHKDQDVMRRIVAKGLLVLRDTSAVLLPEQLEQIAETIGRYFGGYRLADDTTGLSPSSPDALKRVKRRDTPPADGLVAQLEAIINEH